MPRYEDEFVPPPDSPLQRIVNAAAVAHEAIDELQAMAGGENFEARLAQAALNLLSAEAVPWHLPEPPS
ncbi:MAG TPA: hypothetical protein VF603_14650 [Allosphingosinicella sp.]|jgi:hypothetical protein